MVLYVHETPTRHARKKYVTEQQMIPLGRAYATPFNFVWKRTVMPVSAGERFVAETWYRYLFVPPVLFRISLDSKVPKYYLQIYRLNFQCRWETKN
jgi:hypothetical protein